MASFAHLYRVVQDQLTGQTVYGVTVSLCNPGTQVPIPSQLYADSGLSQAIPNPFTTPSGIIDVYLATPCNVAVVAAYRDVVVVADNIAILPDASFLMTSPSPLTILNGPGMDMVLMGVDAGSARFVALPDLFVPLQSILIGWTLSQSFTLTSAIRDHSGALVSAGVLWPDFTAGIYLTDLASTLFPGKVDAYHVSYGEDPSMVLTQYPVTRDTHGNIIAAPPIQLGPYVPPPPPIGT